MENQPKSLGKNALVYGLITGAGLIVFMLLMYILNLYMNRGLQWLSYVIMVGGMLWGTQEYRKSQDRGLMPYGKAFTSSFLIGLYAAIISMIFFMIYIKFINTGMIQEMTELTRQQMEENSNGMSQEQMDKAMSMATKFMSPAAMATIGLLTNVIISAIIAAILAIFLKKEDKSTEIA